MPRGGHLCCGWPATKTPGIGHFLDQIRPDSLFGSRVGADRRRAVADACGVGVTFALRVTDRRNGAGEDRRNGASLRVGDGCTGISTKSAALMADTAKSAARVRISANVTGDFGIVTGEPGQIEVFHGREIGVA